jgi:CheY-like chemotaxis protein
VLTDGSKLRQVVLNLIGNAIKYTNEGSVLFRLDMEPGTEGNRARLLLGIEDTGPGIPEAQKEQAFQPFVRLAPSVEPGTGLGLAISKQYVEAMGGQIGVTSQVGKGSTFRVSLPVGAVAPEKVAPEPEQGLVTGLVPGQPRYEILIAEDHPENRALLVQLLTPFGFQVREAADGKRAVAMFGERRPDVVLMDIRMPVMDGLEAARRIRAMPGPAVPIIAITAHALEEERREILTAGCDGLIRKPFREIEIFRALEKHLGARFVYADRRQGPPAAEEAEVDSARLAALPPPVLHDLTAAVEALDRRRVFEVASRVGATDGDLAQQVRAMASKRRYEDLLNALDHLPAAPR